MRAILISLQISPAEYYERLLFKIINQCDYHLLTLCIHQMRIYYIKLVASISLTSYGIMFTVTCTDVCAI